jgi:predicted nucleotidyltransferase
MTVFTLSNPSQQEVLDAILQRILKVVTPRQVLLFGSASRGQMTSDSDLDLLVIVSGPIHRRRLTQEIYRNLHGILTPVDIVVATDQDSEFHGQSIGSILRPALRDEKVIYEQHPGTR